MLYFLQHNPCQGLNNLFLSLLYFSQRYYAFCAYSHIVQAYFYDFCCILHNKNARINFLIMSFLKSAHFGRTKYSRTVRRARIVLCAARVLRHKQTHSRMFWPHTAQHDAPQHTQTHDAAYFGSITTTPRVSKCSQTHHTKTMPRKHSYFSRFIHI